MKESVIFSKNLLRRLSTNEIVKKSPTATISLNYEYNQHRNAYNLSKQLENNHGCRDWIVRQSAIHDTNNGIDEKQIEKF